MNQRIPVSEIMTKNPVTALPQQSLYEANKLFNQHNIRHLPVVEKGHLIGMVSQTDLLRISYADLDEKDDSVVPAIYEMFTIGDIMTRVPVFIDISSTIKETAEILARQSFHSLPVLDQGKLVGIVTTTDLINYLLKQYDKNEE